MPSPAAVELSCPHYPPANQTGPQYVCRGCNSLIADPRHPQNQALGLSKNTLIARPEQPKTTRSTERRA